MGRQWQRILQQINEIMRNKIIQKFIQDIMKKNTSKIQVKYKTTTATTKKKNTHTHN